MHDQQQFETLYAQLCTSDEVQRNRVAIRLLNQLVFAIAKEFREWGEFAPALKTLSMDGVTRHVTEVGLRVDRDTMPGFGACDDLEIFVVYPSRAAGRTPFVGYYNKATGPTTGRWLNLESLPASMVRNIAGHLLAKCPPRYSAEHNRLQRAAEKAATQSDW